MNEIKCPNCNTFFNIDETGYINIQNQIRTAEFKKEIEEKLQQINQNKELEISTVKKDAERNFEKKMQEVIFEKNNKIKELNFKIETAENEKNNAVEKALSEKDKEIIKLQSEIKNAKTETENNFVNKIAEYEKKIIQLNSTINNLENVQKNEILKISSEKESKITELNFQLQNQKTNNELELKSLNEIHKKELNSKEELIAYYKDFKAKQSVKLLGESLEQHCEIEFNKLRTLFPAVKFGKDNDSSSGTKGDYIYREIIDEIEVLSIMFEMKNESEDSNVKQKNEQFFKKLDKDRREKKCEYAILVSTLEAENELYNSGIVDVSAAEYEKMYVIRPQFFIPIITLLRNAAMKSLDYKKEITRMQQQNIDITNFENDLNVFKDKFAKNYRIASEKFGNAIDEIDKAIKNLEKTKADLLSSVNNFRLANEKADDLTIKKLVKNNPTMTGKFKNLEQENLLEQ